MKKLRKILDPNLNPEEVDHILEEIIQSKYDADLRKDWGNKLQESFGVSKVPEVKKTNLWSRRTFYIATAVAAIFCLFVLAANLFTPSSLTPQVLASSYIEEVNISHPGSTKGLEEAIDNSRENAMIAFNNQNYTEAIKYFSLIEDKDAQDVYFSGLASLLNKNYEEAIKQFTIVPTMPKSDNYLVGSNWYLSLALLLNNEEEKAKVVLSDMLESGDSTYQGKIQVLLKAIE